MQRYLLTEAMIGREVAVDIAGPDGTGLLVAAGVRLDRRDVAALLSRGVRHVFLRDELFPDLPVLDTVPVDVRLEASAAVSDITAALARPRKDRPVAELRHLLQAARKLVEEVLAAEAEVADLGPWDAGGTDRAAHAVEAAAIAVQIGRHYPLARDQLLRLCIGTLLMDVGLGRLPESILSQPGLLDADGVTAMLAHPRAGWQIIHRWLPSVAPTAASVVLQHHERLDGSGYPEGRQGPDIYLFARIAAVADVLTAVRSDRPHRRRFRPGQIVGLLQEEAGVALDNKSCAIVLRHVAIVPHGAIVRLTDGALAKVIAHSPGAPLQPLCVVLGDSGGDIQRRQVQLRGSRVYVREILDDWPRAVLERARLGRVL